MRHALGPLLLAATLFSSACAPGGAGGQVPTLAAPLPSAAPASPVPSVLPGSSSSADAQPAIDAALAQAAAHLGVSPPDLHVDQVEAREFGDSSLGCPKPGLMYSQIVTPGFVIIISGPGKQLEYHADTRGQIVLCQEH